MRQMEINLVKFLERSQVFVYCCRVCKLEWVERKERIDKPIDICDDCLAKYNNSHPLGKEG